VEEEWVETNWASHDVGRLSGEQYPTIHHSQELQVAMKQEGGKGIQGTCWGWKGGILWPRLDYPLSNPIEKSSLEELV
jgi:hypothetical protein